VWQRKIRGWHIAVLLGVIAVVGIAIAVFSTTASRLDAAAMAGYFPARPAILAFIDVGAIRDSGLLEKLAGSAAAEASDYRTFVKNTGFDYKRDLDRVMVNSANGSHYFLLQGRFDWDRLRSYARENGGKCEGYDCSMRGSTPERMISFRKLASNTMALASGTSEDAAKDIQRRGARRDFPIPGEPLWVHVPSEALQSMTELPPGMKLFVRALETAEQMLLTLGPTSETFNLTLDVTCRTEQDAAVMKAQFEGLTALVQNLIRRENQRPSAKDLSGLLTSGSFSRTGRHVIGKWVVERALIESLGG
jgi:hypothetical protein